VRASRTGEKVELRAAVNGRVAGYISRWLGVAATGRGDDLGGNSMREKKDSFMLNNIFFIEVYLLVI
jgi:hypothetical protein